MPRHGEKKIKSLPKRKGKEIQKKTIWIYPVDHEILAQHVRLNHSLADVVSEALVAAKWKK